MSKMILVEYQQHLKFISARNPVETVFLETEMRHTQNHLSVEQDVSLSKSDRHEMWVSSYAEKIY